MNYFLLVYDRRRGQLVQAPRRYSDHELKAATAERFRIEGETVHRPEIEVVLLGADSLETLRKTHGRYFKSFRELVA